MKHAVCTCSLALLAMGLTACASDSLQDVGSVFERSFRSVSDAPERVRNIGSPGEVELFDDQSTYRRDIDTELDAVNAAINEQSQSFSGDAIGQLIAADEAGGVLTPATAQLSGRSWTISTALDTPRVEVAAIIAAGACDIPPSSETSPSRIRKVSVRFDTEPDPYRGMAPEQREEIAIARRKLQAVQERFDAKRRMVREQESQTIDAVEASDPKLLRDLRAAFRERLEKLDRDESETLNSVLSQQEKIAVARAGNAPRDPGPTAASLERDSLRKGLERYLNKAPVTQYSLVRRVLNKDAVPFHRLETRPRRAWASALHTAVYQAAAKAFAPEEIARMAANDECVFDEVSDLSEDLHDTASAAQFMKNNGHISNWLLIDDFETMISQIKAGNPVIAGIKAVDGPHVVIVVGAEYRVGKRVLETGQDLPPDVELRRVFYLDPLWRKQGQVLAIPGPQFERLTGFAMTVY